ncbi:hypothetical protein VNO77_19861 [Canavalia gladiata]|uniref:Uncharacterized protein n=1 Tax=Canavalia gladiata TaxID=3824 RepID=A0AAN9LNE0_CANGL
MELCLHAPLPTLHMENHICMVRGSNGHERWKLHYLTSKVHHELDGDIYTQPLERMCSNCHKAYHRAAPTCCTSATTNHWINQDNACEGSSGCITALRIRHTKSIPMHPNVKSRQLPGLNNRSCCKCSDSSRNQNEIHTSSLTSGCWKARQNATNRRKSRKVPHSQKEVSRSH